MQVIAFILEHTVMIAGIQYVMQFPQNAMLKHCQEYKFPFHIQANEVTGKIVEIKPT
jgi:hypothetical protein